jgi:hypothetical protein
MLRSWAYVRGTGCSSRWRPMLERTQALCGPCVSRRGLSPSRCGRRTLAELHIQDIGPRMLPSSAAPRRGASRTHPCCSFPCSALRTHGTLHSPGCGKHLRVLYRTNPEIRTRFHKKGPPGRMGRTAALLSADCTGAGSGSLPLSALSFAGPLGGPTSS